MTPKRFRAIVDDAAFDVEVGTDAVQVRPAAAADASAARAIDAAAAFTVSADGPTDVRLARVESAIGDAPTRAIVVADGDTTWVCIDGDVWTIDVEPADRVRRSRAAHGAEGLAAPMPATVIRVLAEPGRDVKRGDTLLLLEAMKMELPVRAPRDGRIKAIHCHAGELVQPNVTLIDLE